MPNPTDDSVRKGSKRQKDHFKSLAMYIYPGSFVNRRKKTPHFGMPIATSTTANDEVAQPVTLGS